MVGEVLVSADIEELGMEVIPEVHIDGIVARTDDEPFVLMTFLGELLVPLPHHEDSRAVAVVGERHLVVGEVVAEPVALAPFVGGGDIPAGGREFLVFKTLTGHKGAGVAPRP